MTLTQGPTLGGIINLPAVVIIFLVAFMLLFGTKESATLNTLLVILKVLALLVFVIVTLRYFNTEHFYPFMPFGFVTSIGRDGVERGVMSASAIIFFAFYGFDAIATAAEETHNPDRDLAIGIVGSMLICLVIYLAVATTALGALPYQQFSQSAEPLALILRQLNQPITAVFLAATAVIALPTVILAFFYGQSRIFFAMARDGLLPNSLAKISQRGTPARCTLFTTLIVASIAGLFPLADIAALANAGTLAAFIATTSSMLILRYQQPNRVRQFKAPCPWFTGTIAIIGCGYLFISLPQQTQHYFWLWNGLGLIWYFVYGSRQSQLAKNKRP